MRDRIVEIENALVSVTRNLVLLYGEAQLVEEGLRKLALVTKDLLTFLETGGVVGHFGGDSGQRIIRRSSEFQGLLDRVKKRVEYAEETLDESQ